MAQTATREIVDPQRMSPEARRQLAEDLYEVHCRIFAGVSKTAFVEYVVESRAEHTAILLYKDERGALVGYLALHIFERDLQGVKTAIVRGETGLLREYRGGGGAMGFAVERLLRYMLANPGRRVLYLGSLVHPSSYALLARYTDRMMPSPAAQPTGDLAALMGELAEEFHLERVGEASPLVCKVGWRTIDTPSERRRSRHSDNPAVRFFLAMNPGYAEGHGLLTLIPIELGGVLRAGARFAAERARRWGRELTAWMPAPAPVPAAA